jgi:hypothetical protein
MSEFIRIFCEKSGLVLSEVELNGLTDTLERWKILEASDLEKILSRPPEASGPPSDSHLIWILKQALQDLLYSGHPFSQANFLEVPLKRTEKSVQSLPRNLRWITTYDWYPEGIFFESIEPAGEVLWTHSDSFKIVAEDKFEKDRKNRRTSIADVICIDSIDRPSTLTVESAMTDRESAEALVGRQPSLSIVWRDRRGGDFEAINSNSTKGLNPKIGQDFVLRLEKQRPAVPNGVGYLSPLCRCLLTLDDIFRPANQWPTLIGFKVIDRVKHFIPIHRTITRNELEKTLWGLNRKWVAPSFYPPTENEDQLYLPVTPALEKRDKALLKILFAQIKEDLLYRFKRPKRKAHKSTRLELRAIKGAERANQEAQRLGDEPSPKYVEAAENLLNNPNFKGGKTARSLLKVMEDESASVNERERAKLKYLKIRNKLADNLRKKSHFYNKLKEEKF